LDAGVAEAGVGVAAAGAATVGVASPGAAATGVAATGVAVAGTGVAVAEPLAEGVEAVDAAVEDEALTLADEFVVASAAAELCGPQAVTARQAAAMAPARGRY
jgi:hypothetical protein